MEANTCQILDSLVPIFAVLVPVLAAIVAWWLNERSKMKWERYKRKEERYMGFLESIRGFYAGSQNERLKEKFINDLRLAWLYCPDKIVRAGNAFLATVDSASESTDQDKQSKLAEFELELRRDLRGSTTLTVEDRKNWRSN